MKELVVLGDFARAVALEYDDRFDACGETDNLSGFKFLSKFG